MNTRDEDLVARIFDMAVETFVATEEANGVSIVRKGLEEERVRRSKLPEARYFTFHTHEHPRLHDFFAIYLLINEGWRQGIIVKDYNLCFQRSSAPSARAISSAIREGHIPICVGESVFSKVEVTEKSSVTLNTARWLGLLDDPMYRKILDWSHQVEVAGPGDWTNTAGMIRLLSLAYYTEPMAAFSLVEKMLDAKRAEIIEELTAETELGLLTQCKALHNEKEILLAYGEGDSSMLARIARHRKIDVLIRKDKGGHVSITTNHGVVLKAVAGRLRQEEAQLRGQEKFLRPRLPGVLSNQDVWLYKAKTGPRQVESVTNGGWTFPETEPTAIAFDQIVNLVAAGLKERL